MREVKRTARWSWVLLSAAWMAVAGLPGEAQPEPVAGAAASGEAAARPYRLEAGNLLSITVNPEREYGRYGRQARVRPDGTVVLYKIGEFPAVGKSLQELADLIEARIPRKAEGLAPEVTVSLLSPSYELRKGDQISIVVPTHKEYDGEAIVLSDGNVLLRSVGAIPAQGKTLAALAQDIRFDLLEVEDLVNPRVTVTLLRAAPEEAPKTVARRLITVSGAVFSPGPVDYEDRLTIRRALVLAGGLLREANFQDIRVYPRIAPKTRVVSSEGETGAQAPAAVAVSAGGNGEDAALDEQASRGVFDRKGRYFQVVLPEEAAAVRPGGATATAAGELEALKPLPPVNENLVLWDGDAVEVRLRRVVPASTVRITGLVRTPGLVTLTPKMRLEDLFKEGGLSPLADPRRVQIFRGGKRVPVFDDQGQRVPEDAIDLQAEVQKEPGQKLQLQPDDEVFVPQVVGKVIVIGGVQNPGWRPLKKFAPGEAGPQVAAVTGEAKPFGNKKKKSGRDKKGEPAARMPLAPVPPDAEKWQTIRDFFLQNDKEITAGNQDLPSTYNPSLADLKDVEVIRKGGEETFKVNLIEVTRNAARPDNIWLKPGDVIYLPPKGRPNRGPLYYLRDLPYLGFLFGLF